MALPIAPTAPRPHSAAWMVTVLLAVPLLLAGLLLTRAGFLSDVHAHFLAEALVINDRGASQLLSLIYPPLPLLLLTPVPQASAAVVLGVLALLGIAALLLRDAWREEKWYLLAVVPLVLLTPIALDLATAHYNEAIGLLLLLIAWRWFVRWVDTGITAYGFQSGLVLALGVFASPLVFPLALILGGAPALFRADSLANYFTGWLILTFPALLALVGWAFAGWVFTGSFDQTPIALVAPPVSFAEVVAYSVVFLAALSLSVVLGAWRMAILMIAPFILLAMSSFVGIGYTFSLGVLLLTLFSLSALPPFPDRISQLLLVTAAVLQLTLLWVAMPWPFPSEISEADREEMALGEQLRRVAPGRVLTDVGDSYRLIARTGSARPFLLPSDELAYNTTLTSALLYVDFVLLRPEAGTAHAVHFDDAPPAGFYPDWRWREYRMYRRQGARPLVLMRRAPQVGTAQAEAAPSSGFETDAPENAEDGARETIRDAFTRRSTPATGAGASPSGERPGSGERR